jgi:hypothetical protein
MEPIQNSLEDQELPPASAAAYVRMPRAKMEAKVKAVGWV